MTFSDALTHMIAGNRLSRIKWSSTGQYVFLQKGQAQMDEKTLNDHAVRLNGIPGNLFESMAVGPVIMLPVLITASKGYTTKIYIPDFADMFADDWEIR